MECLHTAREMSVVGFVEVARRFTYFRRVYLEMVSLLDERKPESILLIYYPGFNIRLAREAKMRGIRVIYYVSPQVWAWHKSRIHELKRVLDEMLVIFPFEEELYRVAGMMNAHFVGHPLVERIDVERERWSDRASFASTHGLDAERKWLLVFSGSRTEEVRRLLPVMSEAAVQLSAKHNMKPILVESASIDSSHYDKYLKQPLTRFRDSNSTHELMHHAELGILKSGTTTLEAALLGLPGVICYRTHPLTYAIGKRLVKLPYIGLANIVLGQKLYPELLQDEVSASSISNELEQVLSRQQEFKQSLIGLADSLRVAGSGPSRHVAETLLAS